MGRKFSEYTGTTTKGKLKVECWHPIENEGVNPIDIMRGTSKKYWFQCDVCPHSFESMIGNITGKNRWCPYCAVPSKKYCGEDNCNFCYDKSFKSYTGKTTKGKLKVDCWDINKNGDVNPIDLGRSSHKNYWFQCDVCPHSFNSSISQITGRECWCSYCSGNKICGKDDCVFCYEKSFKSYTGKTTNDKLKVDCWHVAKNGTTIPREVSYANGNKYWFQCDVCHHPFDSTISTITKLNSWCPYCSGRNICGDDDCKICYENSFKSYTGKTIDGKLKVECWHPIKNGDVNPRDVSYTNGNKYWFQCDVCPHSFNSIISGITGDNGTWCPYCSGRNICGDDDCNICYEKSFKSYTGKTTKGKLKVECWHPTKNEGVNPRDVSYANGNKYWFHCDNDKCNNDFNTVIQSITSSNGTWCPGCASSNGEKLLTKIIKELGYSENPQKKYPDCINITLLPFDNCILIDGFPDILFEYDGRQHFKSIEYFGGEDGFILRKKRDIIKNKYCVDNNKVLVRIDHTMDLNIEAPIKQLMEDGIKMAMENKSGIIFSNPELYQECYGDEYII